MHGGERIYRGTGRQRTGVTPHQQEHYRVGYSGRSRQCQLVLERINSASVLHEVTFAALLLAQCLHSACTIHIISLLLREVTERGFLLKYRGE